MEAFLVTALFALVAWWFYKRGKRIGRVKGYNVGRWRKRRRR